MGQKINPIGIRIGFHRKWKYNWFLDNKYYTNFLLLNFEINKLLLGILRNSKRSAFLINCYISKISLEKLYICVFFYRLRLAPSIIKRLEQKKQQANNYKRRRGGPRPMEYYNNFQSKTYFNKTLNIKKKKNEINEENLFDIKVLNILNTHLKKQTNIKKQTNLDFFNYYNINNTHKTIIKKNKIKKIKILQKNKFKLKYNQYKSFKIIKKYLSELTNSKIHLIMINALSFLKFFEFLYQFTEIYPSEVQFQFAREHLTRRMTNFYRYHVKLIPDTVNVVYISLLLKQPVFFAQFIGYLLRKMPQKNTVYKLLQFIRQLTLSILQNRKEILGCRIQFKGRIGGKRSRRSRKLKFLNIGSIPINTYPAKIEYGVSKGITRFGAIGIKIWICYDQYFTYRLQKDLLFYFIYDLKNNVKTKEN